MPESDYRTPPAVEAVIAAYIDVLPLKTVHVGLFWEQLREEYPIYEDAPALPPIPPIGEISLPFMLSATSPVPRAWFGSEDGQFLVQLQADRLCMNWRRTFDGAVYPGLDVLSARFFGVHERLQAVTVDAGLGALKAQVLELNYINAIDAEGHKGFTPSPFTFLSKPAAPVLREAPVRHDFNMGLSIPGDPHQLYVEIQTSSIQFETFTNRKVITFQLFTRSSVVEMTKAQIEDELQRCRKVIREIFESSITPDTKAQWS